MTNDKYSVKRVSLFFSFIIMLYAGNAFNALNELCSDESIKFEGTGELYVIAAVTLPPGIPLSAIINKISAQQQEVARICCAYGLSFGSASEYIGEGKPSSRHYSLDVQTGDSLIAVKLKNVYNAVITRDTEGYYDYLWMASISNLHGKSVADSLADQLIKSSIPEDNITIYDTSVLLIFGKKLSKQNAADLAVKLKKLGVESLTVKLTYTESGG